MQENTSQPLPNEAPIPPDHRLGSGRLSKIGKKALLIGFPLVGISGMAASTYNLGHMNGVMDAENEMNTENVYAPIESSGAVEKSLDMPDIDIDCSKSDYELPLTLEADKAKEAVKNMEFFIDDPDQLDQIKDSLFTSTTPEEMEQIIHAIFEPRGVELLFQQAPRGIEFDPQRPDFADYQKQLTNFVEAYAKVPANLAKLGTKVFVANRLYSTSDNNHDGIIQANEYLGRDGQANPDGTLLFNVGAFGNPEWGLTTINHELIHLADEATCAPGFDNSQDAAYLELRGKSSLTATDKGYDPANYTLDTVDTDGRALSDVVSRDYGLANASEDKSTTLERVVVGRFPDQSDLDFDSTELLYQKQAVMIGRIAEFLQIPDLAEYYAFLDIYGYETHPKRIVEYDISPYQTFFVNSPGASPQLPAIFSTEIMDSQYKKLEVSLPNGTQDTLYYFIEPREDGTSYISLILGTSMAAESVDDCRNSPEIIELLDFSEEIANGIEHGDMPITSSVYGQPSFRYPGKYDCQVSISIYPANMPMNEPVTEETTVTDTYPPTPVLEASETEIQTDSAETIPATTPPPTTIVK